MPPTPTNRRTRRITYQDNALTLPGRVTFPVGSFISNPSTALDGQLGGPSGMLPQRTQYNAYDNTTPFTPQTLAAVQNQHAQLGVSSTATIPRLPAPLLTTPPPGYGPNAYQPTPTGYGTDDSWYQTPAQAAAANQAAANLANGTTTTTTPTPAPGSGDFYGYERDPETGRSVRVVKNAATSNFLNELRWDPQARKYVSIGRLLKQGKLDLKGNWRRETKRQRQGKAIARNQQAQQQQKAQDYSLANSFITFNTASG